MDVRYPFAIIADIHGNRWALEAVLQDIERRGIRQIINLGDSLTGPLDPVGTAELLIGRGILSIYGNDDRDLFAPADRLTPSQRYAREQLSQTHLDWLRTQPESAVIAGDLFACHGDLFDAPYLLEQIDASGIHLRKTHEIAASVAQIEQPIILSGHSHVPRTVLLPPDKLAINPGSVGLAAYSEEEPIPHSMEVGSPHARYVVLSKHEQKWQIEHQQIPYDWEQAAQVALDHQRPDWATALATGRIY